MLKRMFCALLSLVLLLGAFPLSAFAAEENADQVLTNVSDLAPYDEVKEKEPNDTRGTAMLAEDNVLYYGKVTKKDEYDYYKIRVYNSYVLRLAGISGAGGKESTKFRLYNSSGKLLKAAVFKSTETYVEDGEKYKADYFYMEYALTPGTYYIRVSDPLFNVEYALYYLLYNQLDAPKLTASNNKTTGKPVIKWAKVENAAFYRVYRATSQNGTYKRIKSTNTNSFTDTTAAAGKIYYYKVMAVSGDADTADSKMSAYIRRACDCASPEIKVVHSSKTGKNVVKWNDVMGAKSYKVYAATEKFGTYKCIGTTTGTYLTHKAAKSGKVYYYKVMAINKTRTACNSAYSEIVKLRAK